MNSRVIAIQAFCTIIAAMLLSPIAASAAEDKPAAKSAPEIELGAPFADNAVLQREMDLPVWGWSQPGTTVTDSMPNPGLVIYNYGCYEVYMAQKWRMEEIIDYSRLERKDRPEICF